MLLAETALLHAIRDKMRTTLSLDATQCDLELEDQLPAVAANDYYAIIAAGVRPGPRHQSSGGVFDLVYSVRIMLYQRIARVARDKRRSVYDDLSTTLNAKLDAIIPLIDQQYDLMTTAANALIGSTQWDGGKFPEPFRRFIPDPTPRAVMRDPYDAAAPGAAGDPIVALARGITFEGARFMFVRDA